MKNIFIIGLPRTGKTTLSEMISKQIPNYHIINIDAIREAFFEVMPQEINYKEKIGMKDKFPEFLSSYVAHENEWNKGKFAYIIEGYDLWPETIAKYFDDYLIYALYYDNVTPESVLKEIRKYDQKEDWSYDKDDEYMLDFLRRYTNRIHMYKQECQKYNIKLFDTSKNRKEILTDIVNEIKEELK